jgi:hypothetical protein
MPITDTTPRAAAQQLELYRRLTASERAQIAVELSAAVRLTTLEGIRSRHPDYAESDVRREFLRIVYGFET